MEPVSRRRALVGAGLAGVAVPVLTACGDDAGDAGGASSAPTTPETESASASAAPSEESSATAEPDVQGLVAAADVPVGGGVILDDPELVVTQPAKGEFRAFSSTCTHRGCTVTQVEGGAIGCRCHGSRFSIEDGSVQGGPAPSPLPETAVRAEGGQVVRA
ncbi:MAG: Rieske (2Fe-2S) protein [Nocardioides sp.]